MCDQVQKSRKPPSHEQLFRVATQHLKFEAYCLLDCLEILGNKRIEHGGIGGFIDHKKNQERLFHHPVSYHDMLIHTRVLADFLKCSSGCKRNDHRDDVEAGDYLPEWPGEDVIDESDRKVLNKAFAHLSRTRASMEVMSLSKRSELAIKVLVQLKEFTNQASLHSNEYSEWFKGLHIKLQSNSASVGGWHYGESES